LPFECDRLASPVARSFPFARRTNPNQFATIRVVAVVIRATKRGFLTRQIDPIVLTLAYPLGGLMVSINGRSSSSGYRAQHHDG
jgi:hypothetical protein